MEHRGEFARRGAIVDVFPSTADAPIRIDLWGDEVDRLTTFTVNDQRSIADLDGGDDLPGARAHAERARARACRPPRRRRTVGTRAVGAARRGHALRRHGVVGAVARRRRGARHRPAPLLRQGDPHRAPADARPGDGAARRGGRPRQGARIHLGARPRQALSPAARRARPAARRGRRVLDDRLDARLPRYPRGAGVRLGARRRRRQRAHATAHRPDHPGLHDHGRGRRRRFGRPPPRDPARARPRLPDRPTRGHRRERWSRQRFDRGRPDPSWLHRPERQGGDRRRERPHRQAARPPQGAAAQARGHHHLRGSEARQLRRAPHPRRRALRGDGQAHDRRASSATTCSSPTRAATSCTCRPTRSTRSASTSAARHPTSTGSAAATSPSRRAGSSRPCARSPRSSWCSTRSA